MGADSSNGGGSRSGDSVGGLAIVVRTETWGTGDRGPRADGGGGRCQRPTSREPTLVCLEVLGEKVWAAAGRDRTGTGQGRARSGVGFPLPSLFPSLSLSPVPCRCRALKPPIRWHRGPGRAGWCCWLVVGDPRGVAVGSGIVVGAWAGWPLLALVRGRHPHSRGRHPPRTPRDGPEVVDSTAAGRLTRAVPGSPTGGREGWQRGPPRKGVEMGGKVGVNGKWGRQRGKREGKRGKCQDGVMRQRPGKGGNGKWKIRHFSSASLPPKPRSEKKKTSR